MSVKARACAVDGTDHKGGRVMREANILVVDEDETIRLMLSCALVISGHKVVATASAEELLLLLAENGGMEETIDLLLADMELPGLSGLELVDELHRRGFCMPAIIMSWTNSREVVSGAVGRHCVGYFPKPFQLSSLMGAIEGCLAGVAGTREREGADSTEKIFSGHL